MPITFICESWGGYPVIECDCCHKQIEDVEDGTVSWVEGLQDEGEDPNPFGEPGHFEPELLQFHHKDCVVAMDAWFDANRDVIDDIREERERDAARGVPPPRPREARSETLDVFFAQLLGNTGRVDAMPIIDRAGLYKTLERREDEADA